MKSLIVFAFSLALLTGCASSTAVLTGKRRPPISPDHVRVFLELPPFSYEVVGFVTGHSVAGWTQQSDTQRAFDNLRKEAASLGANGVIVESAKGPNGQMAGYTVTSSGQVGTFFGGGASSEATISGRAIYYEESDAQKPNK